MSICSTSGKPGPLGPFLLLCERKMQCALKDLSDPVVDGGNLATGWPGGIAHLQPDCCRLIMRMSKPGTHSACPHSITTVHSLTLLAFRNFTHSLSVSYSISIVLLYFAPTTTTTFSLSPACFTPDCYSVFGRQGFPVLLGRSGYCFSLQTLKKASLSKEPSPPQPRLTLGN